VPQADVKGGISEEGDGKLSSNQALTQLTEQLHAYEKRYNLRSEVFYWLIVGTPAEDQPGFIA